MRNKTGNSLVDLATAYHLKDRGTIKLLRNRIDKSEVVLTTVWYI